MADYIYETHSFKDPLLPFIFHDHFTVTQRSIPSNWHENIEILHCIAGSGTIRYGTQCYPFSQGDLFVVSADTLHAVASEGSVTYRCLIIDNAFCKSNGIPISTVRFQKHIRSAELSALFENVKNAYDRYSPTALWAVPDIRYAVLGLLGKLCRDHVEDRAPAGDAGQREEVRQTLRYIRKHYAEKISLDSIAKHLGISKYHLARQFKLYTGSTVVCAINLMRCASAKQRIEDGICVTAAARACGFENLSYFTRKFKGIFGACPSDFLPKG